MSAISPGSLDSLQSRMRECLDEVFAHAMPHGVLEHIAEEMAHVAGRWLSDRASGEVFDSQGEYVLKRAADEAWISR